MYRRANMTFTTCSHSSAHPADVSVPATALSHPDGLALARETVLGALTVRGLQPIAMIFKTNAASVRFSAARGFERTPGISHECLFHFT